MLQSETCAAITKVPPGTINGDIVQRFPHEPLLVMMDGLLRYAKAYYVRFESRLCDDGVLSDPWLAAVNGMRALLNGDGVIALERGLTTDSKDNGVIEETYWAALRAAGYEQA